jgi:hypothetical protein
MLKIKVFTGFGQSVLKIGVGIAFSMATAMGNASRALRVKYIMQIKYSAFPLVCLWEGAIL